MEETFKKGFFVEQRLFFKMFQCTLWLWTGHPCWKVFAQNSERVEKIKKNSKKRLTFFPIIFHLVHCTHAVECKRKEILLEHLRKCEKMHFKIINVDGIALKRLFKTFFLFHVVKVCEKEVFHFRKLKVSKNCLFAKICPPLFLKIIFNRTWWLKKTVVARYFFVFASMFECAPKLISTEAELFSKRLWIAFTFQTDVRSRWGKKPRTLAYYQRFVEPF